jgi:Zn-dependent M28 family amino/carboxypeptidase
VYNNITNVVAKISWKELPQEESRSILINSHYDTVSGSSGASDDAVGVACMMETIRALSKGPPLHHPIIFLFNGAEESLMQVRINFECSELSQDVVS